MNGRGPVAQSASESAGVAGRYATAIFDLAEEAGALDRVERDLQALSQALEESADLAALISSPVYSREETGRAIAAVGAAMELSELTRNTLGLMASKRRLFTLPEVCTHFFAMLAAERGEVTAEVVSAQPLTQKQRRALAKALAESVGREVKLETSVDESLIGGLVVKLGSKLIDTSIRSKLASLKNAMREVG